MWEVGCAVNVSSELGLKPISRSCGTLLFFTLASLVMGTQKGKERLECEANVRSGVWAYPMKQILRPAAYAALFTLASLAGAGGQSNRGGMPEAKCLVAAAEVPVWQRPTAHCHVPVSLRMGHPSVLVCVAVAAASYLHLHAD